MAEQLTPDNAPSVSPDTSENPVPNDASAPSLERDKHQKSIQSGGSVEEPIAAGTPLVVQPAPTASATLPSNAADLNWIQRQLAKDRGQDPLPSTAPTTALSVAPTNAPAPPEPVSRISPQNVLKLRELAVNHSEPASIQKLQLLLGEEGSQLADRIAALADARKGRPLTADQRAADQAEIEKLVREIEKKSGPLTPADRKLIMQAANDRYEAKAAPTEAWVGECHRELQWWKGRSYRSDGAVSALPYEVADYSAKRELRESVKKIVDSRLKSGRGSEPRESLDADKLEALIDEMERKSGKPLSLEGRKAIRACLREEYEFQLAPPERGLDRLQSDLRYGYSRDPSALAIDSLVKSKYTDGLIQSPYSYNRDDKQCKIDELLAKAAKESGYTFKPGQKLDPQAVENVIDELERLQGHIYSREAREILKDALQKRSEHALLTTTSTDYNTQELVKWLRDHPKDRENPDSYAREVLWKATGRMRLDDATEAAIKADIQKRQKEGADFGDKKALDASVEKILAEMESKRGKPFDPEMRIHLKNALEIEYERICNPQMTNFQREMLADELNRMGKQQRESETRVNLDVLPPEVRAAYRGERGAAPLTPEERQALDWRIKYEYDRTVNERAGTGKSVACRVMGIDKAYEFDDQVIKVFAEKKAREHLKAGHAEPISEQEMKELIAEAEKRIGGPLVGQSRAAMEKAILAMYEGRYLAASERLSETVKQAQAQIQAEANKVAAADVAAGNYANPNPSLSPERYDELMKGLGGDPANAELVAELMKGKAQEEYQKAYQAGYAEERRKLLMKVAEKELKELEDLARSFKLNQEISEADQERIKAKMKEIIEKIAQKNGHVRPPMTQGELEVCIDATVKTFTKTYEDNQYRMQREAEDAAREKKKNRNLLERGWDSVCSAADWVLDKTGIKDVVKGVYEFGKGLVNVTVGVVTGNSEQIKAGLEQCQRGVEQIGTGIYKNMTFAYEVGKVVWSGVKMVSDALGVTDIVCGLGKILTGNFKEGFSQLGKGAARLFLEVTGINDLVQGVKALYHFTKTLIQTGEADWAKLAEAGLHLALGAMSIGMLFATAGAGAAALRVGITGLKAAGAAGAREGLKASCKRCATFCVETAAKAPKFIATKTVQCVKAAPRVAKDIALSPLYMAKDLAMLPVKMAHSVKSCVQTCKEVVQCGGIKNYRAAYHKGAEHIAVGATSKQMSRIPEKEVEKHIQASAQKAAQADIAAHQKMFAKNPNASMKEAEKIAHDNGFKVGKENTEKLLTKGPPSAPPIAEGLDKEVGEQLAKVRAAKTQDDFVAIARDLPQLKGATEKELAQAAKELKAFKNKITNSNSLDSVRTKMVDDITENITKKLGDPANPRHAQLYREAYEAEYKAQAKALKGPGSKEVQAIANDPKKLAQLSEASFKGYCAGTRAAAKELAQKIVDKHLPKRKGSMDWGEIEEIQYDTAAYRGQVVEVQLAKIALVERELMEGNKGVATLARDRDESEEEDPDTGTDPDELALREERRKEEERKKEELLPGQERKRA